MNSPNKIFDSLLVLQYQTGNKKALAILVKRWHTKFCKQAYWYTQDIEASKDIAQDSWGKICIRIHQLKEPNNFGSWALTIVTRLALDWLRGQKKEFDHLKQYKNDQSILVFNEKKDDSEGIKVEIAKAIRKLPKKQRIVLHLFYVEDYSVKEIGGILQISVGTVKSRLFTAREKLKSILKNRNHGK